MDPSRLLFIHGSDSNGQTYKAGVLRARFPALLSPDFTGPLNLRMAQMEAILQQQENWTLFGSSLGGLMAAIFTARHPDQVCNLVLLAPALHLPEFSRRPPRPVQVPTLLIIGKKDEIIPDDLVHRLAKRIFPRLTYLSVDDDHRLHHTAETLDWESQLAG